MNGFQHTLLLGVTYGQHHFLSIWVFMLPSIVEVRLCFQYRNKSFYYGFQLSTVLKPQILKG